jgi:hypothetical protein
MSNRWITTESGDLLNLDRVREVLMDCDFDGEYSITAYDSDPLHQENMWVLYSTTSQDEARAFMAKLEGYLSARSINLTLEQ